MRRIVLGCVIAMLGACAAPALSLAPRFVRGDRRTYILVSDVETTYDIPSLAKTERTHLEASAEVVFESETRVRITVTPIRFSSGSRSSEPPPPQQATLTIGREGRVENVNGASPPLGGSRDELGALLGAMERRLVHLGDHWSEPASDGGSRSSTVSALQYTDGQQIALISTTSKRPATRERASAQGTLALKGTEISLSETSFSFELGYPIRLDALTEGRFRVEGTARGGTVVIRSHTTVSLRSHTSNADSLKTPHESGASPPAPAIRPTVTETVTPSPAPTDNRLQSPR